MRGLASCAVLFGIFANCTYGATEVVVALDTDLPATRTLTITASVRNGATGDGGTVRTWARGGPGGQITLPQTFAIVPGGVQTNDGIVTLVIDAQLEPGDHGEPRLTLRRTARFHFTPRTSTALPIFLPASCGAASTGCTSVASGCTVSIRCEEMGQTCGNNGQCVSIDVVLSPADGGVTVDGGSTPDVSDASSDSGTADVPPGCTGANHMCGAACVSNMDIASCGPTMCTPCPTVANSTATCDGTVCDIRCNTGFLRSGAICVVDVAPRPMAPLSTATVTSRHPTLRWALPTNITGAQVEFCHDRACTNPITSVDAMGTSAQPASDLPMGVIYWRLRGRIGASMGTLLSPTWQFYVGARSAPVDASWGTVLDVNGDGLADALSGADTYDGQVFLFLGSGSGLMAPSIPVPLPGSVGSFTKYAVASAGDINGDGFGDVVVGAANTANMFVLLGGANGLAGPPVSVPAPVPGGSFGSTVSGAGDINGDGYADVVVGDYQVNSQGGEAYVYRGSPTGLNPMPQTLAAPSGGVFGMTVSDAGDVDGDGFGDVAVAATMINQVYVYRGSAAGLGSNPEHVSVAGITDFGQCMSSAGDVNGDGYDDIVIGTYGTSNAAWVFYGSPGMLGTPTMLTIPNGNYFGAAVDGAGDLNADGYADVVVGADLSYATAVFNGSPNGVDVASGRTFMGSTSSDFGRTLAGAGDVNGDGFDDLLIGAFNTPAVFLFPGSVNGADPSVYYMLQPPASSVFGASLALLWLPRTRELSPFWKIYS